MNWCEEKKIDESIAEMMQACANDEGAILRESYQNAVSQPLPAHMDDRYKLLIEKSFSRKQKRIVATHIAKTLCLTLLCLLGLVGIGTVTAMSMESLREPVLEVFENYYVYQNNSHMQISGEKKSTISAEDGQPTEQVSDIGDQMGRILAEVIPAEYKLHQSSKLAGNTCIGIYENDAGKQIAIFVDSLNGITNTNIEGAELIEDFVFHGHKATWIIDYDRYRVKLNWIDEDLWSVLEIGSDILTQEEVLDLAEQIYAKLKE